MFRQRSKVRHAPHVLRHVVGPGWRAPGSLKYRYLIEKLCKRADAINKAFEAMAMAKPIVTSRDAIERVLVDVLRPFA